MKTKTLNINKDPRFNPYKAEVSVFGRVDTIANHFGRAQRWVDLKTHELVKPRDAAEALGAAALQKQRLLTKLDWLILEPSPGTEMHVPGRLTYNFYTALVLKHFDSHPELIEVARGFDKIEDKSTLAVSVGKLLELWLRFGRGAVAARAVRFNRFMNESLRAAKDLVDEDVEEQEQQESMGLLLPSNISSEDTTEAPKEIGQDKELEAEFLVYEAKDKLAILSSATPICVLEKEGVFTIHLEDLDAINNPRWKKEYLNHFYLMSGDNGRSLPGIDLLAYNLQKQGHMVSIVVDTIPSHPDEDIIFQNLVARGVGLVLKEEAIEAVAASQHSRIQLLTGYGIKDPSLATIQDGTCASSA